MTPNDIAREIALEHKHSLRHQQVTRARRTFARAALLWGAAMLFAIGWMAVRR